MKRVIIESPYAAANGHTVAEHEAYARRCMADSLARGEAPLASHLLYTQPGVLDDTDLKQRALGMEAGFSWMREAELVAFYTDLGFSHGMREGQIRGRAHGVPVVTRHIGRGGGVKSGRQIAAAVDPNVSDDVCTFCVHADWAGEDVLFGAPVCQLGHTPYFHSLSNVGPIWVSDCGAGQMKPELAAIDKMKGARA